MRCLLVACSVLAAVAPGAVASRAPAKAERAAILSPVVRSLHLSTHAKRYSLSVRVSTVSARWAVVRIGARRGYEHVVQGELISVERVRGRWRVHQAANGGGCGVPSGVRRDLHLFCV